MFSASHELLLFEHFRVPYRVSVPGIVGPSIADNRAPEDEEWVTLTADTSPGRRMRWPAFTTNPALRQRAGGPRRFTLRSAVAHGHVLAEADVGAAVAAAAAAAGGTWEPHECITDGDTPVGRVWCSSQGDVLLPFDPDELLANFWSEAYRTGGRRTWPARLRGTILAAYYTLRPVLPRAVQVAARRAYSRVQARTPFPRWPVEPSLHQLCELLLAWTADLAGVDVPHLAPWPSGRTWAFVLTHDVETDVGLRRLSELRAIETAAGFRSSWNFVPRRYRVPDETVADLQADGFEVGLHGLYHDGRDLADGVLDRRLPEMIRWSERWHARGFRSPATHRSWETMASLPFEYDSSSPDTDPFEPQPGGCCSWLPFFNHDLVELPITLPQDHTLFAILRHADGRVWREKTEVIRAAGGMALLITHPDYLSLGPVAQCYADLLAHIREDPTVWRALPIEVTRWWRRRAASRLEWSEDGWRVVGPAAADARIVHTRPGSSTTGSDTAVSAAWKRR